MSWFFHGAQIAVTPVEGAFSPASQAVRAIPLKGGIERRRDLRPRHLLVRGGPNWCGSMF
ncbi:hypothetical protein EMIT0P265_20173 [Pseudomonas zeae]